MHAFSPGPELLGMGRPRRHRGQVAGTERLGLTITRNRHLAFEHKEENIELMAVFGTRPASIRRSNSSV